MQINCSQQITSDVAALYETVIKGSGVRSIHPISPSPLTLIDQSFDAAIETYKRSRLVLAPAIVQAAQVIFSCLSAGCKVLVCGNGGSAADLNTLPLN